jgi:hypothetical protein
MFWRSLWVGVLLSLMSTTGQAGTATANLTVNLTQVGAVPPVAAAAGFTTLAVNYDFSSVAYADPNTNWLDCTDSDDTKIWHLGSPGVPSGVTYGGCDIHQKFDSVAGANVLNVHLDVNTNPCNSWGAYCSTSLETRNEISHAISASYPNKYFEAVVRIEGTYPQGPFNGPAAAWEWPVGDNGLEGDNVELQYDSGGYGNDGVVNWCTSCNGVNTAAWITWNSNYNQNIPSGWSPTAYHKYGMLTTSDGSTAITMCWFIDDVLQSCTDAPEVQSYMYTQRKFLIMTAYAAGGDGQGTGNAPGIIVSRNLDVQYMKIYSCDQWPTQMCNGSTRVTNGNLTYWH